ncbi:MAG: ParB/RepB/Spo0J family partition protein [Rhodospirillaceae bacterium]|nr:ParB/RepB/Spo0J family partition protein [Rhodospirillaceae bacterium]
MANSDLPLGEWISRAIDQARQTRDDPDPLDESPAGQGADEEEAQAPAIGADARTAAEQAAEASGLSVAEWIGQAVQDAAGPPREAAAVPSPAASPATGPATGSDEAPQGTDPLGIDAMDAARQAAESAGLSLNQWIGDVIHDAQAGDDGPRNSEPPQNSEPPPETDEDDSMRQAAGRAAAAAGVPLGAWLRAAVEEASSIGAETTPPPAPEPPALNPSDLNPPIPNSPALDPPAAAPAPMEAPAPGSHQSGHQDVTRLSRYLPLDALQPGPFQAREDMDPAEIVTLSESIREKGVLQPILVRLRPGHADSYHVIAGERRWRAARMAGLREVPTIVLEISDREAMQIALVENLVRRDLNPIEEAQGFRRLIDEYAHTQDELAELVGRSRSHVANMLRLLRLPEDIQTLLREGELSASHGRALVNAPDASDLARQVIERDLNVRQTEALVQRTMAGEPKPEPPATSTDLDAAEKSLAARLGMRVRINMRGERGTLSIRFRGQEGLETLLARLGEKE